MDFLDTKNNLSSMFVRGMQKGGKYVLSVSVFMILLSLLFWQMYKLFFTESVLHLSTIKFVKWKIVDTLHCHNFVEKDLLGLVLTSCASDWFTDHNE